MNSLALLLALLVVAYIGSSLAGAQGRRAQSLVSGVEYVLLGAIIGPHVLGIVSRGVAATFEPLAIVALGWLAMADGFHCGYVGGRRVPAKRVVQGWLFTLGLAAIVAAVVALVASNFGWLQGRTLWVASIGMGLVSCESTRHAVRWVADRKVAQGPLSQMIAEVASVDSAVSLPGLAIVFLIDGQGKSQLSNLLPSWAFILVLFLLGVLLGTGVVVLFKMPLRKVEAWGVLVGTALFGVGVSMGVGGAWTATLFVTGLTLSLFVTSRGLLRQRFLRTEQAVLLPALLLAGTWLEVPRHKWFFILIIVAFLAHAFATVIISQIMRWTIPAARQASPLMGPGLLASGPLSLAVGFACALRVENIAGQLILATAIADTLLGELVGPFTLRRVLRRAGEFTERTESGELPLVQRQGTP